MQKITYQVTILLAGILSVIGQATIETTSQTIKVAVGNVAQFECKVRNLQPSQTVFWEFIDHNITISKGSVIHAENYENKYSIYGPQDAVGYWNLQIYPVLMMDAGTYKCYVGGTADTVKVIHHLEIINAPPVPDVPALNVTDCCIANGVDKCALPFCDTATPITDLIPIALANENNCIEENILQILKCAQGGKNHLGCCMRNGLSDLCQNLCKGWGEVDGTDYTSCIGYGQIMSYVTCFKEGDALLPSPPTDVSAINTGNSLVVTWQPPHDNPQVVVGYKVQYREQGTDVLNSTSSLPPNSLVKELTNLELNEVYEIQVIAIASSGASQPSLPILKSTAEVVPLSNYTQTIQDCCKKYNVSSKCQGYCAASLYYTGGHPDMLTCLSELETIYQCIAGHGDHSPCCGVSGVPVECLGLCRGEPILDWNITKCLSYMTVISACLIEGSVMMPDPPQNTRILAETVTDTSAVVAWDAPGNFKTGDEYLVSWRVDKVTPIVWNSAEIKLGTTYKITNLEPGTKYDVVVSTVNKDGSSLPELTLILITEATQTEPDTLYNETECCMKNGVRGQCLQICEHNFRLTDNALTVALTCVDDITAMLLCSTDGRDHRPCCKNIGLEDQCLDICYLQPGTTPSTALIPCAIKVKELSTCFDEGKGLYPRPPQDVEVKTLGQYSIVIDWQEPGGGPNITSYTVEYSLGNSLWTKEPNTSLTYYSLNKLTPNTRYYIRVTSNNENGQSTPSNVLSPITKTVPINKTDDEWMQLWQDRNECCKKSNISMECQSMCLSGIYDELDTRTCSGDIDKIIACAADGRDHSECCKSKIPGFSPSCLPYCQGQPGSRDISAALCLTFIGPILSCFTEGQGLLPTPPQYVKAVASNSTEITMKWSQSASNCNASCYYITYIWQDSTKDIVYKDKTKLNTYVFKNLSPMTRYRVAVAAYNGNGMSLPSPYIILTTPVDSPHTVSVSHDPLGVVDSGTLVRLICATYGAMFDRVKWLRNSQRIEYENIHVIPKVSSKDQGLYTCNVTFVDGKMMSEDLFLNVRYKPVAKKMTEKTVVPNMNQDAKLLCEFEGFPDTIIWTKDGNTLQRSLKYSPTLSNDYVTGKTTSTLLVMNVVPSDFGSYTCTGSNKFGKMHSTGSLRNFIPVTPTSGPFNKTEVSECCISKGVPLDCSSAICTYDIDINSLFSKASLTHCANYLPEFFTCGNDGKDHTQCCSKDGVPEACLPFCAGAIPDHNDQLELMVCLPHGDTLINCLVHGSQYIPSAPRNVHAKLFYDTVQVFWDAPQDNPDKVNVYHIYYKSNSLDKTMDAASKQSRSKTLQSDLIKKGETYIIWLKAVNDFGSSQMSVHTNITITGLVPPAPINIQGNLVSSNTIEIKWTAPKTKLKIIGYVLHYQALGGNEIIVRPVSTQANLVNLEFNTRYIISVAAVSADGEGQRTNKISVTTGEAKPGIVTVKPQAQTQETVGIVVGVVLGLIFLVAIAIVAIILFRRMAQEKPTQNQTVSFENPQYASGQRVTGLPGENENGSFGYGKLNEEHDNEHMYVTLDNTQASSNTDTPATLDLNFIPVTPTSGPFNKTEVSECCISKGVPLDCSSAICTYDIDINSLFSKASLTHCANYLPEFFTCGNDGKDHTQCCSKDGVPEACLPFCAGAIPDHNDQLELMVCLPHGDTLINCLVHGSQYIPSAPRNVHAKLFYDTVQVFWDAPQDNPDKVNVYHIYYKSNSLDKTMDAASKQSRSKTLQSDLIKKGETYIIWLKAVNDFGSSQMSVHTNITITGLVPPAPINIQGNLVSSNTIEIKWTAPKTKLKIIGYVLHYQALGGNEIIVRPVSTQANLVNLEFNTRYIISVAAVSADGEGQRTNKISVTTGEAKPGIVTVKPQAQTQETVGIVVGVVLGLIFLVAIAIVAIILFRRMAQEKPTQNQTVSFENPQYASGQRVTGLPGENENGSFGYGKLNEEHDNEHMYVTLDNTQASSNTDTPATLDLSQS